MKAKAAFLLVWISLGTSHADWKEKAWQCETAMTRIRIIESTETDRGSSTAPEVRVQTDPKVYYSDLVAAVAASFYQLSSKASISGICRYPEFIRNHRESMSTVYGYSFEEQEEKTHDFIIPFAWNSYHKRIKKIQHDPKYPVGDYQVCNFVCFSKRVDPSDKSISLR